MKRQSRVQRSFLRSQAIAVSVASLILAAAEDSFFPAGLTPFIALAAHLLIDRYQVVRVSVPVANVLGLIAFVAMAFEFFDNTLLGKLMAGAHLLVYITWVVLLLPKGIRQYWWIAALSVLQIAVASVLTDESSFGVSLIGMLIVMIWMLSLFTLFRAQIRVAEQTASGGMQAVVQDSLNVNEVEQFDKDLVLIENGLQIDTDEQWIGWRFRGVVTTAYFASLAVALVTFVAFPRIWVPESPLAGFTESVQAALSRTGFTETVELGEIGEIMQSDARVLQFRITSMLNRREISPEDFTRDLGMDELLFRGNAVGQYDEGVWNSGRVQMRPVASYESMSSWLRDAATADFRMEVTQDPPINQFAFAPAPLRNMIVRTEDVEVGKRKYSLTTRIKSEKNGPGGPLKFEAWYAKKPDQQQDHSPEMAVTAGKLQSVLQYFSDPLLPLKNRRHFAGKWCITPEIERKLPLLYQVAQELCTENGELVSEGERLNRIFHHLNTSGDFAYSLQARIEDYSIDPVEDFLVNRKSGHCEYFASACVLMLQAVDVPARIVNGYKGYEENVVNGRYEVKQKHAHSWAEAWVDDHWVTLDPTPAAARNAGVQEARSFAWWTDLKTVMNDQWVSSMQMMNPNQQKQMIKPIMDSLKKQWQTVKDQGLWATLKLFVTDFLLKPQKWFSLTTLVVTFLFLFIPALILRRNPFRWLKARLASLTRWARGQDSSRASDVRFYEMFRQACRQHGLSLTNHSTAMENASIATQFFESALHDEADRTLPHRVALAFNEIRFGGADIPAEHRTELRSEVNRWSQILKQKPDPSKAD